MWIKIQALDQQASAATAYSQTAPGLFISLEASSQSDVGAVGDYVLATQRNDVAV